MIRAVIFFLYGLVVLFLVRLVTRAIARLFAPAASGPPPRGRAPAKEVEDLIRDPTCHTYVPRSRAVAAIVSGREEHFCSTVCRDKALAAAPRAS